MTLWRLACSLKGFLLLVGILAALCSNADPSRAQGQRAVSMELVLLIDVSASVDSSEYALQALGLATAFASPEVRDAIDHTQGGLAIAVIQWADAEHQKIAIDWSLIENGADALQLSSRLASMPRLIDGGHTALSQALTFALAALETNSYDGLRRVIDLSGDGRNNDGPPLRGARRQVLDRGITINGLAILNELPLLESYFREHLIGGPDAFVLTAADYQDFAEVMTEKLIREIGSMPIAWQGAPATPLTAPDTGAQSAHLR